MSQGRYARGMNIFDGYQSAAVRVRKNFNSYCKKDLEAEGDSRMVVDEDGDIDVNEESEEELEERELRLKDLRRWVVSAC